VIAGYVKLGGRRVPLLVDARIADGEFKIARATPKARAVGYANGFIAASSTTWAWNAALNLAAATRPEGLP
jgi:hypothetical protein